MPGALLLDFDGVLVQTQEAWLNTMNAVAQQRGTPPIDRAHFLETWGQSVEADAALFFQGANPAEIGRQYTDVFAEFVGLVRIEPHAKHLFDSCRQSGLPTAIVTNAPLELVDTLAHHFGLKPIAMCAPSKGVGPKPAPDLLIKACDKTGVDCCKAWFVGDTSNDRAAAKAACTHFVGYGTPGDSRISTLAELIDQLFHGQ
ncbi:HAD family hydrolase (plasmid) [Paraburkholderia sp. PREW-6R]|uniref:HAD family hydrolase n=1 Tax=Paraburkholderia sp. PREW-6R TaxID=3141544 RepID=UPI0031F47EA4